MASSSATGGGESSAPPVAMEVAPFEDGQYVRLLNCGRGGYLFADETGRGVSIDRRRGMVNTAWAVQILETDRAVHVLLRGAYGRYLAVTRVPPRPGHIGFNAAQCIFDEPEDNHVMWWTTPGKRGSVVLLHGTSANLRALRANGRYRRWNRCVTVEAISSTRVTSMMEWEVQVIPLRVGRPPYQLRPPGAEMPYGPGSGEVLEINYDLADDSGNTNGRGGTITPFYGRSLTELGNELAHQLGNGIDFQNITLFVRAGNLGQLTPLLTDLPHRDDSIDIVVFMVGTPAKSRSLPCRPRPFPTPPRPTPPGRGRAATKPKRKDGLGAVLPALRRQPLGGGHLGRHGRALRGHLLAPHLPHRHLQLPPRLHRAPLPQARLHEVRFLRQRRLLQLLLLPARGVLVVAGQEDGPRRDQPQGRRTGAVAGQAQVWRRRGRRALRRLRPAQLALRGPRRRQAALRTGAARPAHEPPRHPRERPHRLLHGLPLLPLLHQHPDQPPEAARLRTAPRSRRGRWGALPHARSESKLSCVYTTCDGADLNQE